MGIIEAVRAALFGSPAVDGFKPDRTLLLNAFTDVVTALSAQGLSPTVWKQTRALLYADLSPAANSLALVYGDTTAGHPEYNDFYLKVGGTGTGSWAPLGLIITPALSAQIAIVVAAYANIGAAQEITFDARDEAIAAKDLAVDSRDAVAADKAIVAADKATVAADKAIVAADKAIVISNRQATDTAKTAAETAAGNAISAAQGAASGVYGSYVSRAAANAVLASIPANAFVQVFADESNSNHWVYLQKVSGSLSPTPVINLTLNPQMIAVMNSVGLAGQTATLSSSDSIDSTALPQMALYAASNVGGERPDSYTGDGVVIPYKLGSIVCQTFVSLDGASREWSRSYISGAWSDWYEKAFVSQAEARFRILGDGSDETSKFGAMLASGLKLIYLTKQIKLSSNVTIPTGVVVDFSGGGSLTSSVAVTVTCVGQPISDRRQIFFGSITASGIRNGMPEWWGAVADGNGATPSLWTDNSTAVQALFDSADAAQELATDGVGMNPSFRNRGYAYARPIVWYSKSNNSLRWDGFSVLTDGLRNKVHPNFSWAGRNLLASDSFNLQPTKISTVTMTVASPCVITWTAHGLLNGMRITLTTTGVLPTGLSTGVTYYIVNRTTNTFQLSATKGGSAIGTSGSPTGTHTATSHPLNEGETDSCYVIDVARELNETSRITDVLRNSGEILVNSNAQSTWGIRMGSGAAQVAHLNTLEPLLSGQAYSISFKAQVVTIGGSGFAPGVGTTSLFFDFQPDTLPDIGSVTVTNTEQTFTIENKSSSHSDWNKGFLRFYSTPPVGYYVIIWDIHLVMGATITPWNRGIPRSLFIVSGNLSGSNELASLSLKNVSFINDLPIDQKNICYNGFAYYDTTGIKSSPNTIYCEGFHGGIHCENARLLTFEHLGVWSETYCPTGRLMTLTADLTLQTGYWPTTTLAVTEGALRLKATQLLRCQETGEFMQVVSTPTSDTSVSVIRGWRNEDTPELNVSTQNPILEVINMAGGVTCKAVGRAEFLGDINVDSGQIVSIPGYGMASVRYIPKRNGNVRGLNLGSAVDLYKADLAIYAEPDGNAIYAENFILPGMQFDGYFRRMIYLNAINGATVQGILSMGAYIRGQNLSIGDAIYVNADATSKVELVRINASQVQNIQGRFAYLNNVSVVDIVGNQMQDIGDAIVTLNEVIEVAGVSSKIRVGKNGLNYSSGAGGLIKPVNFVKISATCDDVDVEDNFVTGCISGKAVNDLRVTKTVASAATIDLTNTEDVVLITGTTSIATINGLERGQRKTLVSQSGFATLTSGNIQAAVTVATGRAIEIVQTQDSSGLNQKVYVK